MADISTLNKNAELLRINKQDQIDALNELGFTDVTMETPMSEIAECIKWAGGIAEIHLAAYNKASHVTEYLTVQQWSDMGITGRANYARVGLRIRAEGHSFILAAEDAKYNGGETMMWGGYGTDISGITNYGEHSSGLFDVSQEQAIADNARIIEKLEDVTYSGVTGAPACEAARDYAVSQDTADRGWYLPSVAELRLVLKYYDIITQAFVDFDFATSYSLSGYYWTCNEYSAVYAWYIHFGNGNCVGNIKLNPYRCRPVAPCP